MYIDKLLDADCFYKINTAEIMLTTKAGRYINNTDGSTAPVIIRHYDEIKIVMRKGIKQRSKIFYVETILPQESGGGNQLQIELVGRERLLEKFLIPGKWEFYSVKDLVREIVDFWNTNKGTAQPRIELVGSSSLDFSEVSLGTFDFGDGITIMDALRMAIAFLNQPVQTGGLGKMHYMLFSDIATSRYNGLLMRIRPQGNLTDADVVLGNDKSLNTNQIKITRTHEQLEANVVVMRGEPGSGTWPKEIAQRTARIEEYANFPLWNRTNNYPAGVYVRYNNTVYLSSRENISITPGSSILIWREVTEGAYVESGMTTYSPLTDAAKIKSMTLRPNDDLAPRKPFSTVIDTDSSLDYPAFTDSNLIINEQSSNNPNGVYQNECMARIKRIRDIPSEFFMPGAASTTQEGMKFLLDANLHNNSFDSIFFGTDKQGNNYNNALVQQDQDGDWIVVRVPQKNDVMVVRNETAMYEYQQSFTAGAYPNQRQQGTPSSNPSSVRWRNITNTPGANHCFHYPIFIQNFTTPEAAVDGGTLHFLSGTQIIYQYQSADYYVDILENLAHVVFSGNVSLESLGDAIVSGALYSRDWYCIGWWTTLFEAPYPVSGSDVGDVYKNPVLRPSNQNNTPSGKSGYLADDGADLGTFDGFSFWYNLDVRTRFGNNAQTRWFQGGVTLRATIYDSDGNTWIKDAVYRLNGVTQPMVFLFSEFTLYKARAPLTWTPSIGNIAPAELYTPSVPERQRIKRINLQIQDVYDEYGRYDPSDYSNLLEKISSFATGTTLEHAGWYTALAFIKAPIAVAKTADADANPIMDKIEDTEISNVEQLQKAANATLDLKTHRNDIITIEQPINLNYAPGMKFYLNHKYLINESEKPGNIPNTKRFIVIDVNYVDNEKNGLIQQIHAIKEIGT